MYAAIRDSGRFRADYADAADCVCQLRSLHDYLTKGDGGRRLGSMLAGYSYTSSSGVRSAPKASHPLDSSR